MFHNYEPQSNLKETGRKVMFDKPNLSENLPLDGIKKIPNQENLLLSRIICIR